MEWALIVLLFPLSLELSAAVGQPHSCQVADALVESVLTHAASWDLQVEQALNSSWNCSEFLDFSFFSRERDTNGAQVHPGKFLNRRLL